MYSLLQIFNYYFFDYVKLNITDFSFILIFLFFYSFFFYYNNDSLINSLKVIKFFLIGKNISFKFFFLLNFFLILFFANFYITFFNYNIFNLVFIFILNELQFLNSSINNVLSLDYLNFYFIVLNGLLFFIIFLVFCNFKYKKIQNVCNIKFMSLLILVIEFFIVLTFLTSNFFFFFFFFECSLMPMYFLMQVFGKGLKKKQYASYLLVFFTLLGSIFLLLGIIYINLILYNFDFKNLNYEIISFDDQILLFILFFLGFSVKVPIFPFYSWLPEAHVEASTSTSIILASIILKTATYALIKIIVFNFYLCIIFFNSIIIYLSIISIFVGSFLAIFQVDLKKIIALSSVVHMNYMVISIFSLDSKSILGGIIYMFSHAFISSSLFYIVGYFYDSTSNRDFLNYSSSLNYSTKFVFYLIIFNLANISFPLTVSFVSELIIFNNLTYFNIFAVILIVFSIFFSTIYTFWLIHNLLFNKINLKKNYFNMNKFDFYFLNFFLIFVILFGIFPFLITYNFEQEIYILILNNIAII